MEKQLVITLSKEATKKYLELARQQTSAELDEDCEPSDVLLQVTIAANNTYESIALLGKEEIGEVSVSWLGRE
jgi:hypothetical protein